MYDKALEYFLKLVQIDSESKDERAIADYLKAELTGLGGEVFEDNTAMLINGNAGNLIAWFPGDEAIEPLILNAHMDTVKPGKGVKPLIENGKIFTSGETILGADDKSGIALILAFLTQRKKLKSQVPLEIIITVAEEIGLLGAKNLPAEKLRAKRGYSLDGNLLGEVVKQSPSQINYKVKIFGKSVHAGVEPENGINALKVAAEFINLIPDGRIDTDTTMNIGKICGGKATNIVCDEVEIEGEIRSHNPQTLENKLNIIKNTLQKTAQKWSAEYSIDHHYSFRALKFNADEELLLLSSEAFSKSGLSQKLVVNGGGSDANALAEKGIRLAVIGTGMQNIHCTSEFIRLEDIKKGCLWLQNLLQIWEGKCTN